VAWLYPDLLETDKYPAPSLFADVVIETPPQSKMRKSKHKARAGGEFIALLGGNSFLSRQGIKEQGEKREWGQIYTTLSSYHVQSDIGNIPKHSRTLPLAPNYSTDTLCRPSRSRILGTFDRM
jgi:hypothetical protein